MSDAKKSQTQLTSVQSQPYGGQKEALETSQFDAMSSHHASTLQSNLGRRTNEASLFQMASKNVLGTIPQKVATTESEWKIPTKK